jgi:uncharacterized membrane protein YccF (DUF307 family)
MMTLLLNLLWFVFGGFLSGLAWVLAAILMIVTIIGIPWAGAALTVASFTFWPFGRVAVDRRALSGRADIGAGGLGLIGNIIWFVVAGWWLALGHLAAALGLAVTIIGIPFAFQHVKLAILAIAPIGQEIVPAGLRRF